MGQGGGRGEVTGWRDGWWVGDGKKPSTTRSSMMERREKHGKGEERADMTRRKRKVNSNNRPHKWEVVWFYSYTLTLDEISSD